MNRYYYYPVILCMLTNTILFIPRILMNERFTGAIPAALLSIVIGPILASFFTKSMMRFPRMGLPEIFKLHLPKSINMILLLYLGFMWFSAGGMVLVSYCRIVQRFVNPDLNLFILIGFVGLACALAANNNSQTVLYILEIILIVNLPLIGFILFKALTNTNMDWGAVRVMSHYSLGLPSWNSFAAVTYIFTGYVNWAIFNRCIQADNKLKYTWTIPVIGALVILTTFVVPIGYHGTIGVDDYNYTWASTVDSMRVEFGFVERVLFIFLLLYFCIALLFITMTWHVSAELIKSILPTTSSSLSLWRKPWVPKGIVLIFLFLSELSAYFFNEKQYIEVASDWFQLRLPSEILLVILVYGLGKRRSR